MNIALIGYGKMGKAIEQIALAKGHRITLTIDLDNLGDLNQANLSRADVAIEFTGPSSAFDNVMCCLRAGIPTVSGSTGWVEKLDIAKTYCLDNRGSLIWASNFSIGVNIFFEVNKKLATLMAPHQEYQVSMVEVHHTQKKDAPSGTAITLAEQILAIIPHKNKWVNQPTAISDELEIRSERIDPAAGIHKIRYHSEVDEIEIIHTALSRAGFASGAVLAAEFIRGKKGVFSMQDVLGF
jgi:4-hydroxy-tetrahydrodipicolinate reductase